MQLEPGFADYPKNAWYVVATSEQVTREPFHREALDRVMVLFRQDNGTPVALFDRCPHRGYPLSEGVLVGDNIQCGYHGMQFGPDGRCQIVPSGFPRPKLIRTPSIPIVERWEWVWAWAGDPAEADPSLIPDLGMFGVGREGWHSDTGIEMTTESNYLMWIENLLDATHITFLHEGQIDQGEVAPEPLILTESGGRISGERTTYNEEQAQMTMVAFGFSGGKAHRTITTETLPPALCGVRVRFEDPNATESSTGEQILQLIVAITPIHRTRCMVLTAVTQTFPFLNPARNDDTRKLFTEDGDALEKIQKLMDTLPKERRTEFGVPADRAAYRAREILARMLRHEAGELSREQIFEDELSATVDVYTPV